MRRLTRISRKCPYCGAPIEYDTMVDHGVTRRVEYACGTSVLAYDPLSVYRKIICYERQIAQLKIDQRRKRRALRAVTRCCGDYGSGAAYRALRLAKAAI